MKTIIKIMLVLFFLQITSCALNNNAEQTQEAEAKAQAIKTAKINAELGMAYLERKDLKRSKQKLLLALQQAPNIPEPWYSMAYFLEVTGDKDRAKQYYLTAIKQAPQRGDAHNNYGTFLCRAGQYQAAIEQFVLATKDPNYLDLASAYENAGLCARLIPRNPLALYYFNRAIMQDPSRTLSLANAIELYLKMDDLPKAKAKFALLQMVAPDSADVQRLNVAITEKEKKQLPAAVQVFATDLNQLANIKEVNVIPKKSHDPLLPYPPAKKTPTKFINKPLKVVTLPKLTVSKALHIKSQFIWDVKGKKIATKTLAHVNIQKKHK